MDQGELEKASEMLGSAAAAASSEPLLSELSKRANQLLAHARHNLHEQERHLQFLKHRREVLFEGTQFTGVDLPATVAATLRAGHESLTIFGLTLDGGGQFTVDPYLADHEAQIADQCYEVLLIVAEAVSQQDPLQSEQSMRLLDQAVQLRAPTRSYHERRARYFEKLGESDAAKQEREHADALQPSSALDHFLLGDDLLRRGLLLDAIADFKRALHVQSNHFWSRYLLGLCHLQIGAYAMAEANLTACLSEDQGIASWIHLHRGIAHIQLRQFKQAEDDFKMAHKLSDPESARHDDLRYAVFVNRGVLRGRQGRLEAAVAEFNQAIRFKPNEYQAYYNLANAYHEDGQPDAAIQELGRTIDVAEQLVASNQLKRSELVRFYHNRADLRWDRDRVAALDDLQLGLGAQEYAEGHFMRGEHLQLKEGNFLAALDSYEAALKAKPVNPKEYTKKYTVAKTYGRVAECMLELKRYKDAVRFLDLYLKAGQPDAYYYRLRGLTRSKLEDYLGAIHDYTQALTIEPGDSATHAYRGWVYYTTNAPALALDDFQKAIEIDPDNVDPYSGRGCVRVHFGEHVAAVTDAKEALRRQRGSPTFRTVWHAARIHAMATGVLDAQRGRITYEPATRAKYYDRALDLIRRALELIPAKQVAAYWRRYFEDDSAFSGIRASPEFIRLGQEYAAERKAA